MKRNLTYIGIVLVFFLVLYFYNAQTPKTLAKCPDDYATTEEQMAALNEWTNNYYDNHPGASLADWSGARLQYWKDNGCTKAIERYNEAKSGKADPETMNFIKETITEQTYEKQ